MDEELLQKAIDLVQTGDKNGAMAILKDLVTKNPKNETAWLWLAACFDNIENKKLCLQNVLKINPVNQKAKQALERLSQSEPSLEEIIPNTSSKPAITQEVNISPITPPKPAISQEVNILSNRMNEQATKQRMLLLIVSSVLLLLLLFAPVWNSNSTVENVISMKIIGNLMQTNSDQPVLDLINLSTSMTNAAIEKYQIEFQAHNILVVISVILVGVELLVSRVMKKHFPKVVWLGIGIILLAFPVINLFLSWNLLLVPGMVGTIIGATLFIVAGIR